MLIKGNYQWVIERHEWELQNRIVVAGMGKVSEKEKAGMADHIRGLLAEFQLPFEVETLSATGSMTRLLEETVQNSLTKKGLDADSFLSEISKRRKDNENLLPAIVLKINASEHKFSDPKAIYGVGYPDGLIILRKAHKEAVRHEMGHMLGIAAHCTSDPRCVMKWECPSENFCQSCRGKLQSVWGTKSNVGN